MSGICAAQAPEVGGVAAKQPTWRQMVWQVEELTGVRRLLGGGRWGGHRRAQARQLAMALARALYGWSYPLIGARFGGLDHTTAIHACAVVRGWLRDGNRWACNVWIKVMARHGRDAWAYYHWQLGPLGADIEDVIRVVSELCDLPSGVLWGGRRTSLPDVAIARAMVCRLARAGRSGPGWAVAEALGVSRSVHSHARGTLAAAIEADAVWRVRLDAAAARLGVVLP